MPRIMDIVRTPKGAIAMITTVAEDGTSSDPSYKFSLTYLGSEEDRTKEPSAWWKAHELEVIGNLSRLLAVAMTEGRGSGAQNVARRQFPESFEVIQY